MANSTSPRLPLESLFSRIFTSRHIIAKAVWVIKSVVKHAKMPSFPMTQRYSCTETVSHAGAKNANTDKKMWQGGDKAADWLNHKLSRSYNDGRAVHHSRPSISQQQVYHNVAPPEGLHGGGLAGSRHREAFTGQQGGYPHTELAYGRDARYGGSDFQSQEGYGFDDGYGQYR